MSRRNIHLLGSKISFCAVNLLAGKSVLMLFFLQEPELYQIGLDPAVQGVPLKKKTEGIQQALFLGVFRKLQVGRERTQAQFWAKNSKYWRQLKILSKKVREN